MRTDLTHAFISHGQHFLWQRLQAHRYERQSRVRWLGGQPRHAALPWLTFTLETHFMVN